MTPDEVDILVAALDDCQDLVRKFARLRHPQMDRSYFGEIELLEHLKSAITQIQDYQKLREITKDLVRKVRDYADIGGKEFNQDEKEFWAMCEKTDEVITYLQQPTEH